MVDFLSSQPLLSFHSSDKDPIFRRNRIYQMKENSNVKDSENVNSRVALGAALQILGGGGQTIIRIGASMVLARVLEPSDFGLFGMALLARELVEYIGNVGIGNGVIAKKDVSEKDLSTAFWVMVISRFVLFVIAFSSANLVAFVFSEPRLISIFQAISFTFLFSIVGYVPMWLLQKRMDFAPLVIIRLLGILIESCLAVFIVLTTSLRVEALVVSFLVSTLFSQVTTWLWSKWLPRFIFDKVSFRYLFNFGIHGLGTSLIAYFHENLDYILIGRLFGASSLGLYEFAYRIPHLIFVRIAIPVSSVIFPALALIKDENSKLIAGYLKASKYIGLIVFPVLGGLAVLAPLIIDVLWGPKWLSITIPLRILCVASAVSCIVKPVGSIFLCKDRPDIPFKISILNLIFAATTVPLFGYFFGLNGVACAMTLSTIPGILGVYIALKMTNSPFLLIVKALMPPLFCSLCCSLGAFYFQSILHYFGYQNFSVLISSIISGAIIYSIALFVFYRELYLEIFNTAKSILSKF